MMDEYVAGLLFWDGTAHRNIKNRSYAIWIDQHKRNSDILEELERIFVKLKIKFYKYKVPDNKIRIYSCSKERFLELKKIKENPVKFFKNLNMKGKKSLLLVFLTQKEQSQTD